MTTAHEVPWRDDYKWKAFRDALTEVERLDYTGEAGIDRSYVAELRWRHWNVAFAVEYSLEFAEPADVLEAAECGVADGTTAYIAMRQALDHSSLRGRELRFHLYDAWAGMDDARLLPSEAGSSGRYQRLSLEATRQNLDRFASHCRYHVGYIPESLSSQPAPASVFYVHIDLNASVPTREACEFFWPRLVPGGVILFDDYGWLGFEDTKAAVDEFFSDKPGVLLKFPTGQAVFLRRR